MDWIKLKVNDAVHSKELYVIHAHMKGKIQCVMKWIWSYLAQVILAIGKAYVKHVSVVKYIIIMRSLNLEIKHSTDGNVTHFGY